jgi:hypothetical protein
MTTWLDRKERIQRHDQFVTWRLEGEAPTPKRLHLGPSLTPCRELIMTKHPSLRAVPLDRLQDTYGAPLFRVALRRFISATNNPNQSRQQLERSLWGQRLPFTRLPIWHVIKFTQLDSVTGKRSTADAIHARPTRDDKYKRPIPGRFDTVLVNDGTGKERGVRGKIVNTRTRTSSDTNQAIMSDVFALYSQYLNNTTPTSSTLLYRFRSTSLIYNGILR